EQVPGTRYLGPPGTWYLLFEHPDVVAQERDDGSVGQDRVDLDVRSADHEVGMHVRDVHAVDDAAFHGLGIRAAVGHVARRVLVEQRLEEHLTRLPDARG